VERVVHLLRPTDVARQLNVSRAWVYEAAKDGRIPSVRIGGRDGPLRFVPDDIDRWLQEARAGWTPGRGRRNTGGGGDDGLSRPSGGRRRAAEPPSAEQQQLC
jgi:excisionase family DNA binding protein